MQVKDRIKELRRVKASELLPSPANWRLHPREQSDALRGMLEDVGFADAVLVRETPDGLMLIDGHLRAELMGKGKIPVLVLDVTEEEADKILLTLDPLAAMAGADQAKLQELLGSVEAGSDALRAMLEEMAKDAEPAKDTVEDDVPEPPANPITKPGDLWLLGKHRLLCGDSTNKASVERLMGGHLADLCFTSPPYGQQREYTKESTGKVADWDGLMCGVFGNLPVSDAGQVLVNLGLIHRDGEWVPYWDGWIEWMRKQGWRRFGWYVWDQGFGLPGDWSGRFAPSHEFVFHFNRESKKPLKCVAKKPENIKKRTKGASTMRGKDGVCREFSSPEASAQTAKVPDSIIRINRMHGGHNIDHPAVFPVEFPAMVAQCWPGLMFDPFLGSGTTLIAAEQLDRICYGMEISPQYCDVIVKRWEKLTSKKAAREK